MTKSFQFLVIASGRRSTERGLIKKTYLDYVCDYKIFIQKVYMSDINDKLFTDLLEMEIFHKWSIKYYLIQTLFYRSQCTGYTFLFLQGQSMKPPLGEYSKDSIVYITDFLNGFC